MRVNNNTQTLLKPFSIYRVPKHVRDSVEKKHYEPKLVAIGPYHRKKGHLRAMEERKQLYLQEFLRASEPLATYQDYVCKVRDMEHMARARYFESPVPALMTPDEFVEMLVLDGCFILQFFIKWYAQGGRPRPYDPILDVAWILPLLHNDLLMLDNQIPYDVLVALYGIYCHDPGRPTKVWPKKPLMCIIAQYFSRKQSLALPESTSALQEDGIAHLLHLYHCHFITPPTAQGAGEVALALPLATQEEEEEEGAEQAQDQGAGDAPPPPSSVPCAKELELHGVSFRARKNESKKKKKKSATNIHILDVTFSDGIFHIPPFSIEEPDCSRYMNLVAFEMSHRDVHKKFTSYVVLMDYLIDTPDDVLILERAKILTSQMSRPQEVADFFNQLRHCSYIDYKKHYLRPLYVDVEEYCNRKCPRHMARLRRDYLSTPWAGVAFSFGLLFACFTIFGTVISVLQTFFHLSK